MRVPGKCPECGRPVAALPADPWRPFCSERCRLLDLGAWFGERRAIPGEELKEEPADEPPPAPDEGA